MILVTGSGAAWAKPNLPQIDLANAGRCDFIASPGNRLCLLPFPNDYYTVKDRSTATGRRVNMQTAAMPANADGTHIDAEPYNLNDGFSPGQPIVLRVPGLDSVEDMRATGAAPINHIGRFKRRRQPIVLIDAETGRRAPIWSEIDSNATDPESVAVEIHPAKNLKAKHRYIVALRNLRTAAGERIPAPAAFRYYRDDVASDQGAIEKRRDHYERIFKALKRAGIGRGGLYLAWDFTVASDRNIGGRLLHLRDEAFAELGDTNLKNKRVQGRSPAFQVDEVNEFTPADNPEVIREVIGAVAVPCYLAPDCAPGGRFQLDGKGLPTRHGTWEADFRCIVPRRAALGGPGSARAAIYGHGLFGSDAEIRSDLISGFANEHAFVICATDEIGMSSNDLPNTAGILVDLSRFPELTDRVQQGLLNELYLGRALIHPSGFSAHPAFHVDGTAATPSVIDTSRLYYEGNSQGGILGGALTAVAPDFTRAVLGVPGMRYSLLLPRATPFDQFAAVLYPNYPDQLARPLMLSLTQMLWDRSDPNGYAHRMTRRPFRNTPKHKVLMAVAFGDHQVTNFAADVQARTIGASTHVPILDPGRWPGVDVLWNVPAIKKYPFKGSAIVYSDIGPVRPDPTDPGETIGTPPPPLENLPNREGEDPHGAPRGVPAALEMANQFLAPGGRISNVCGKAPCYAGGFTGR
ncbi:MAG: hypothetical protein ACRDL1_00990 [Solirubrobacterales bacterium]